MENQMTFDEIYARELKKIKQDPVSFVWNNCIKKHDDQEFMVITYPKEGKYPKYFIECLYFLRFDISEIKYGSSTTPYFCRIITMLNLLMSKKMVFRKSLPILVADN